MSDRRVRRVLYSFPHPIGSPGVGTTALNQVRGLVEQDLSVTVACTSTQVPIDGAQVIETLSVAGRRVPLRALGVERGWDLHDRMVARRLARSADGFDVVHTWPLAARHTLATAAAMGVPGVREVPNTYTPHAHEIVAREYKALGMTPGASHSHTANAGRVARELEEYERADLLLVPSEVVARTFRDVGISEDRLGRHQYGCDLGLFRPSDVPPPEDRPFTAAFVGLCEPRKGLHHALRAWKESGVGDRDARLIVCGEFVDGYRMALGDLLDQPGVEVRGFVDDVPSLLAGSDVLILPSVEEGSALVTYEAQACGAVLLASRESGARCVDRVEGLLHDAGDVTTLASQLSTVAEDPERLAQLRDATLGRREELGWSHAASVMLACYDQAAARAS